MLNLMAGTVKRNKSGDAGALIALLLAVSCLFFSLYGCGTKPKHYTRPDSGVGNLHRIAVLPIENFTNDGLAAERVRKLVIAEILSKGVDVVEPGEVTSVLIDLKLKSLSSLSVKDIQSMAKTLGVDVLMMGSVEAYGISNGVSTSYPEVSVHLILLDGATGNVVWSAWNTSGGPSFWTRHFGVDGPTLSETARKVVRDAVNTLL